MNIHACFKFQQADFHLDVDLDLPKVGISAIYGPSGCGKTTLLRLIAGLDYSESGYFRLGSNVWQDQHRFLQTHKRPLGYIFQEPSLFPHMNVADNIQYGRNRAGTPSQALPLDTIIQLLGISDLLKRQPQTLSGGERQRVAIARALATNPELLLMDEPLAAIDSQRKQEILPYLQSLNSQLQIPVIYVTHSIDEAAQLADQLVFMEKGNILANGEISKVMTQLEIPLGAQSKRSSIINGCVSATDKDFGISYFNFPGGRFAITSKELPVGQGVRVQVFASDVSLSLERATSSSILNIFPARVVETLADGTSQVLVKLKVGDQQLLSLISRKSADRLNIILGTRVFAQIKSAALLNS